MLVFLFFFSKMSMNKSDFVKQELRNICNARSEKQMAQMSQHHSSQSLQLQSPGQQSLISPHSQTSIPQQQSMKSSQLPPYPQQQQMTLMPANYESEIPSDILEQSEYFWRIDHNIWNLYLSLCLHIVHMNCESPELHDIHVIFTWNSLQLK